MEESSSPRALLESETRPLTLTAEAEWTKKLHSVTNPNKETVHGCCRSAPAPPPENDAERKAVAMQIDQLDDLEFGSKLYLSHIYDESWTVLKKGTLLRMKALDADIAYGICAALVPTLIPFGQTYKDSDIVGIPRDWGLTVGTIVSVLAVICSLCGTILHVWLAASKTKEQALLYSQQGEYTKQELFMFLAKSGEYDHPSGGTAYKAFLSKYKRLRANYARFSLFTTKDNRNGQQSDPPSAGINEV
eukprot:TRINITY_DN101277_c0_g1_i1.p1 TRINITY_DN101277_c0_g1~~TRINITY_DN101277_c0_g1_i1.p1  ORF type:complete len:247 (-),score=21.16 TRINITY_DN101277_c0_g1_i1:150-890(-)